MRCARAKQHTDVLASHPFARPVQTIWNLGLPTDVLKDHRRGAHFGAAACADPTQKPHGSKFNAEDGNPRIAPARISRQSTGHEFPMTSRYKESLDWQIRKGFMAGVTARPEAPIFSMDMGLESDRPGELFSLDGGAK
jgi:hypothetical protein